MKFSLIFLVFTITPISLGMQPSSSLQKSAILEYIEAMPADIRPEILVNTLVAHFPRIDRIARDLREVEHLVTPQLLVKIFDALPYTANAIDLFQQLTYSPQFNFEIISDKQIFNWLANRPKLVNGKALYKATSRKKEAKVFELLKNKQIDLNALIDNHATPLHRASLDAKKSIVEALLQAGANPNIKNKNYETPLMFFARFDNPDIVRLVVDAGGDLDAVNKEGANAYQCAFDLKNYAVAAFLQKTKENRLAELVET